MNYKAFLNEQAGILAEDLAEGAACTVCGSTTHPKLAVKSATAPTEADVNELKSDFDKARKFAEGLSRSTGEIKGKVDLQIDSVQKLISDLLDNCELRTASETANGIIAEINAKLRRLIAKSPQKKRM